MFSDELAMLILGDGTPEDSSLFEVLKKLEPLTNVSVQASELAGKVADLLESYVYLIRGWGTEYQEPYSEDATEAEQDVIDEITALLPEEEQGAEGQSS